MDICSVPALLPGIEDAVMNSVKVSALGPDTGEGGKKYNK